MFTRVPEVFFPLTSLLSKSTYQPQKTHRSLADFFKDLCTCVFGNIVSYLQISESSRAFGMNNSFWNSLAIKVSHFVDEVDILKQNGSAGSNSLSGGFYANRGSMTGCCDCSSVLETIKNSFYAV